MSKLLPIAELIKQLLELEFKEEAKYTLESKKDWLLNIPDKDLYKEFWEDISDVYGVLVDDKWTLDDKLGRKSNFIKNGMARIDIWFEEPYNFICEFDEKQHFNQYRLMTLERGYKNLKPSFDYNSYYDLSSKSIVNPGKSGFHKLKGKDILFPEILKGDKQDNRIRQRAFRDYLKDIVPVKLGYNPTVRINYQVTNNKIKDFTKEDLENIKRYLYDNDIFQKALLKDSRGRVRV
ncbi:hypothetical protein KQI41_17330 [Tissierella pigra]|jgi:hypothetical protein|uniref:DUF7255 family protein n=1 Tax=Tissierella pigra TaxID=2607614 RepID=UPI001C0F43E6|nr:hypothetical protein [Tissierella pigra]MBU5428159.1 hypothetical protein [Tissierella pigra]